MDKQFTDEELRNISLCVGWTLVLADNSTEGNHRKQIAEKAMKAFRRVYGEGYHYQFIKEND